MSAAKSVDADTAARSAVSEGDDSWELLPIYAYEEVPPVVKSREEIVAEKLAALKRFSYTAKETLESDGSGAQVYLTKCARLHQASYMKFPTASVAKDLRAERETLDLSHAGLGTKGAVALAAALRNNSAASALVLTGNAIAPSAAMEIVRAINESRFIISIDLSSNALGKTELLPSRSLNGAPVRGGGVINELLGPGSAVAHLSLRGNELADSDVLLFADTLAENVNLQSLDLSDNRLGPSAAVALAAMLSRNSDLRTINLEWNQFGPAACRTLVAEGFLLNNTIKSFNLSACGLDDTSAQFLARIISENATEEIIIANNRLSSSGAELMAKALSPSSSLATLVMDGNRIGDAGCLALITAASACFGFTEDKGASAAGAGLAAAAAAAAATSPFDTNSSRSFRLLSLQHCGCSAGIEERYRGGCTRVTNKGDAASTSGYTGIRVSEGFGQMVLS